MNIGWNDYRDIHGAELPRWVGVADEDFATRRTLLLPIPLNRIYRLWIAIWLWLKSANRDYKDYRAGFKHGWNAGHAEGVDEGRRLQQRDVTEVLEAGIKKMVRDDEQVTTGESQPTVETVLAQERQRSERLTDASSRLGEARQ